MKRSNISLAFITVVDPAQGGGGGVLALLGELRVGQVYETGQPNTRPTTKL